MYNPDLREAFRDYLTLAAGGRLAEPHPIGEQWHRDGIDLGECAFRAGLVESADAQGLHRALNYSDMPGLLATAVETALISQAPPSFLGHRACCVDVDRTDYKSGEIYEAHLGTVDPIADGGAPYSVPSLNLDNFVSGRLSRYVIGATAARRLVINNDMGAIASILNAARLALLRTEAATFASYLESNPTVGDGGQLFDATNATTVSGGALTAPNLQTAVTLLRDQPVVTGTASGVAPAILLVPSEMMITAGILVQTLPPGTLRLVTSPYLSSATTWFVVADPAEQPALTRLRFQGNDEPTIEMVKAPQSFDAMAWRISYEFSFLATSRFGIVKVSAS